MKATTLRQPVMFDIAPHGEVVVMPHRSAVRLTLRRKTDGTYSARAPYGADLATLERMLAEMLPRLAARTPSSPNIVYRPGWNYDYPEGRIEVARQTHSPDKIIAQFTPTGIAIGLGRDVDPEQPATTVAVGRLLSRCAARLAPKALLPRASELADRLGITDIGWEIGRGKGLLGSCYSSSRRIRLSALLLFLPLELRDFVVAHELAHLDHPDHSPAFHRQCNAYCNGREAILHRSLKSWQWPLVR